MIAFIFDTETTGLINTHLLDLDKQPEIIEFYGATVNLKTGKVTGEFETTIQPHEYPLSAETIKATRTKLSNSLLAKAPAFAKVAKAIKLRIEAAPLIIAHNASFDMEMVNIEFERLGQKIKWPKAICTVEQTCHLKGYRLSLTNLHKFLFGKDFDEAHRAKPDTQALIRCAVELFKRGQL